MILETVLALAIILRMKKYFKYVKNFHIKDRKLKSKTVRLGRGNAKLKKYLLT